MRVISKKALRDFWQIPKHAAAKEPLLQWYQNVSGASWHSFSDVRKSYNTADRFGKKTIFDIDGNKYRLVAIIDFKFQKVFVRAVMDHKDYDKGHWKKDTFGDDWD